MTMDQGALNIRDERGHNQIIIQRGSAIKRAHRRSEWFVEQAQKLGARRVLEIGSGLGDTAAYVAQRTGAEVVAVDISPAFIQAAQTRHGNDKVRFNVFDLVSDDPGTLGQFDLVYGNGILHHLTPILAKFLKRLHGLLEKDGAIAFIEPNLLNPICLVLFGTPIGRRLAHLEPNEMAFTRGKLCRLLAGAGWRDIDVRSRDFLLPGLPIAMVRPIVAIEPLFEATPATWWLAQSHFIRARTESRSNSR